MRKKSILPAVILMSLVIVLIGLLILFQNIRKNEQTKKSVTMPTSTKVTKKKNQKKQKKVYAWDKPSEESYPEINSPTKLSVSVSIKKQRVYIKENHKTIYTMVCSTGDSAAGNPTPKGKFVIEPERFKENYWAEYQDWAFNLVSFSGHGTYLFHSILMWDKEHVEEEEAAKLGKEASHGCIRLPLPDSKWFYDNIPVGTPVEIY